MRLIVSFFPLPVIITSFLSGRPLMNQLQAMRGVRPVSIVYAGRNFLSAKARNFIDYTVSQYSAPEGQRRCAL
jgi:hypothetical protein